MDLSVKLNNLMIKYKFKPEKKLGQHFILNPKTIELLLSYCDLKEKDIVLEIGAGTGFLTEMLLKKSKVIAIEIDEKLCNLIENEFKKEIEEKKLSLIKGNFLEKINELKFNKIVSFPPYYLSKELIESIFFSEIEKAVLVLQNEFAEKLTALPGFVDYNAISVLSQYFFEIELKEIIPKTDFFPQPKADSRIVIIRKAKRKEVLNEKKFIEFVNEIFRYKNKKLSNALKKSGIKKINFNKITEKKVMQLNINSLIKIFNKIYN